MCILQIAALMMSTVTRFDLLTDKSESLLDKKIRKVRENVKNLQMQMTSTEDPSELGKMSEKVQKEFEILQKLLSESKSAAREERKEQNSDEPTESKLSDEPFKPLNEKGVLDAMIAKFFQCKFSDMVAESVRGASLFPTKKLKEWWKRQNEKVFEEFNEAFKGFESEKGYPNLERLTRAVLTPNYHLMDCLLVRVGPLTEFEKKALGSSSVEEMVYNHRNKLSSEMADGLNPLTWMNANGRPRYEFNEKNILHSFSKFLKLQSANWQADVNDTATIVLRATLGTLARYDIGFRNWVRNNSTMSLPC